MDLPERSNQSRKEDKGVFVGRYGAREIFRQKINNLLGRDDARSLPFIIKGIGGQGKTALGKCFSEMISKNEIDPNHHAFTAHITMQSTIVDEVAFLIRVRNKLARSGFKFPAFDFAVLAYYAEVFSELNPPNLERPFYGEILKNASDIGSETFNNILTENISETAIETVGTIPVLGYFAKKAIRFSIDFSKEKFHKLTLRHFDLLFDQGELKEIDELHSLLPQLLAGDINTWIATKKLEASEKTLYGVIFFDEYERLYENQGKGSNMINQYICDLVSYTDSSLFVILTRQMPEWEGWGDILKKECMDLFGLPVEDARDMLLQRGIQKPEIIDTLISNALEESERELLCLPRLLDLQIQHIEYLESHGRTVNIDKLKLNHESFEERLVELVQVMLREFSEPYREAFTRLSICDEFDQNLFDKVSTEFGIGLTKYDYSEFITQPLVTELETGTHEVLHIVAEIIRSSLSKEYKASTERYLLQYFEQDSVPPSKLRFGEHNMQALVKAANYKLALDPKNYHDWLKKFKKNMLFSRYSIRALELFTQGKEYIRKHNEIHDQQSWRYTLSMAECLCAGRRKNAAEELIFSATNVLSLEDYKQLIMYSSRFDDAYDWYKQIPNSYFVSKPSRHLYIVNNLMRLAKDRDSFNQAVLEIQKHNLKPDKHTYAQLIRASESFEEAFQIATKDDCRHLNMPISITLLLKAHLREEIQKTLHAFSKARVKKSIIHLNILLNKENHEEISDLIEEASETLESEFNVITYTSLISQAKSEERAEYLYQKMKDALIQPDSKFFTVLLNQAASVETLLSWMEDMHQYGIKANIYHWEKMIVVIQSLEDLNAIFKCLIDTKQPLGKDLFSEILRHVHECDQINFDQVVSLLMELVKSKDEKAEYNFLKALIEDAEDSSPVSDWLNQVMHLSGDFRLSHKMLIKAIEDAEDFTEAMNWLEYCEKHDISQNHLLPKITSKVGSLRDADEMMAVLVKRSELGDSVIGSLIKSVVKITDTPNEVLDLWLANLPEPVCSSLQVLNQRLLLSSDFGQIECLAKNILDRKNILSSQCILHMIRQASNIEQVRPYLEYYISINGRLNNTMEKLMTEQFSGYELMSDIENTL